MLISRHFCSITRCLRNVCLVIGATTSIVPSIGVAEGRAFSSTKVSTQLRKIFDGQSPRTADELKAMQDHVKRLAPKVIASTVAIRLGPAHGSGVIVSEDGYILTAAHVAGRPGMSARVILPDGTTLRGKSLGVHFQLDAGLIKITDEGSWPYLKMAESGKLLGGQWCAATGHPGGFETDRAPVFRLGRVLSQRDLIRTDCQLIGGDSGGPLVDMYGRVIGVHSRIGSNMANNQHVPIAAYKDHWDQLVSGETLGLRPWMGVEGSDSKSAEVARVISESPAEQAGIRPGDVITSFGDTEIAEFDDLRQMVLARKPGDKVKLRVRRGEKTLTVEVTLGHSGL